MLGPARNCSPPLRYGAKISELQSLQITLKSRPGCPIVVKVGIFMNGCVLLSFCFWLSQCSRAAVATIKRFPQLFYQSVKMSFFNSIAETLRWTACLFSINQECWLLYTDIQGRAEWRSFSGNKWYLFIVRFDTRLWTARLGQQQTRGRYQGRNPLFVLWGDISHLSLMGNLRLIDKALLR